MCYGAKNSNIIIQIIFIRYCFVKFDNKGESSLYKKKCREVYTTLCENKQGNPKNAIKASEHHVGVKRGVKFKSLSCSPIRNVL